MKISGLGGYRRDIVARSSNTSVCTVPTDGERLLETLPIARTEGSSVSEERAELRLPDIGYRASEPILIDFDLPLTAATEASALHRSIGSDCRSRE